MHESESGDEEMVGMKLQSEDRNSSITFVLDNLDSDCYPSLNLVASVEDKDFRGAASTWVCMDYLTTFVAQLKECEHTGRGRASLISMSPDEFELVIENSDSLGHFLARYKLAAYSYTRQGGIPQTLTGGFDLDSEFFA